MVVATVDKLKLIEGIIRIDNKQGIVVPLVPNRLQRYFYAHKTNRNIILKHRQGGCCLDPDTLILTKDFVWKRLEGVSVGEELIGFDEYPTDGKGNCRCYRTSTVEAKISLERESFLIETDRGSIIATGEHRFLTRTSYGNCLDWRKITEDKTRIKKRLKVGTAIRFIVPAWSELSYEDGWFGGIIDGEGSITKGRSQLKISQKAGTVMDRCKNYLSSFESHYYTEYGGYNHTPVDCIEIYGIERLFTLVGKCRPSRFLNRTDWWEGKTLSKTGGASWGIVKRITPIGVRTVIDLQISTGTFIANGFASHNSSFILGDMFTDAIIIPNTQCAVISHETRATQRLLDRVDFFYDNMEEPKPLLGSDSRSELSFPEMHSSIYIGTAGSRAFGRGDTIRKALLSELAFYENPQNIFGGVSDAVPMTGEIDIECTPNGEDNLFYEQWVRAREGKSPYKPFFFPWWWSVDYTIPKGSEYALSEDRGDLTYTSEESELIEKHHLTEGQIRWRRWKIAEKQGLFWQEYPEDEVSCFIVVGDPVFDQQVLESFAQSCYDGDKHKYGWTYWIPPNEKGRYVVGADSSAGAPGGSYSAAVVLNERWEVCATYQARVEPHIFAGILKQLGLWYNTAEIAVERNFTGYAVLSHLQDYPHIYYQRDFTTGKITSNRGWWTNDQTRQYMISATKDFLTSTKPFDMNLVRQLRSYRYIKYRATAQTFDDLAIAFMIAVAIRKTSGGARGYQGAVKGWDW